MPIRLFLASLLWLASSTVSAQSPDAAPVAAPTLAEQVDAAVRPVADAVSGVIFASVRVAGTDETPVMFPLIVGWLILAGVIFTLYFRFINIRG